MKLTGPKGDFELTVLDYEYSDSASFLKRNWLIVSLLTKENNRQSTRMLTLLSTWELELLHDWMQSVAENAELAPKLTFIEPSLSFSNFSSERDRYDFRIRMADDATPTWHHDETRPYWMPVTPNKAELEQAIHDLARQLAQFPVRD